MTGMMQGRVALEARWLALIGETLPGLAGARQWPVRFNHCFARIILDQVCGGCWYDHVPGRPAYRHLDEPQLRAAVALAEKVAGGACDLVALNAASLAWRRARRRP
jgi:hypothetical protein